MFAVIATGGKQYRVQSGDLLDIERLRVQAGDVITLVPLLVVDDAGSVLVGTEEIASASVTARVVEHRRGRKIRVFTYKNKSGQQRHQGHRQELTRVRVEAIEAPAASSNAA